MNDEPVPSPCTRVCTVDPFEGCCSGCHRSLEEIAAWSSLGREERLVVLERVAERKREAASRAGSGKARFKLPASIKL